MPLYAGQVLRVVAATGEVSATYLKIDDADTLLSSLDATSVYNICGEDLPAAPVLDSRLITGTRLDGSTYSYDAVHFFARGKDFYLLRSDTAPESIATVATSTPQGAVDPLPYLSRNLSLDDQPLLSGHALMVRFNALGAVTGKSVQDVTVSDDDALIQFDGQNGAPNSETGVGAQVLFGPDHNAFDFNTTAGGQMALVRVSYHAATGNGTFEALRYTLPVAGGSQVYYLPKLGSVDLATVTRYLGETLLAASADGLNYADFGLNQDRQTTSGTGLANFIAGEIAPDRILGLGGADSLVGGMGADLLDGGAANDLLQGGSQNDLLLGGTGSDQNFGGNDRDRLYGGTGDDRLTGNWGNDTLFGGAGNDRLASGSDNDLLFGGDGSDVLNAFDNDDTLDGGAGADTLTGGTGADVFVFHNDGATDRISDFANGSDHIALDVAFATLTITTISPGTVQITNGGEVLIVADLAHLLTAADLTAADFI